MSVEKVYWTPGNFKLSDESWSYLYAYPEKVDKNKFVFRAQIDDQFKLPMEEINRIQKGKVHRGPIETDAMLAIFQPERSEMEDRALIQYNMNWHFFSENSLIAKTSLPTEDAPVSGAIFDEQSWDIGLWYKQFPLRYHIPLKAQAFNLTAGTPLFYLELETDNDVEFIRYDQSPELHNIAEEYFNLRVRYGRATSEDELNERIQAAQLNKVVLSYIHKNII